MPGKVSRKSGKKTRSGHTRFEIFFRKILKEMAAETMVTDPEGLIRFTSDRFLEVFGGCNKSVTGRNWVDVVVEKSNRPSVTRLFQAMKEEEKLSQFELSSLSSGASGLCSVWTVLPLTARGSEDMYLFMGSSEGEMGKTGTSCRPLKKPQIRMVREEVSRLLFTASERSDPETARHALRAMVLAERLAREAGISERKIEDLKTASLLHDLGKMAVDPEIFFKREKLTSREFQSMKEHLSWGVDLLSRMHFLKDVVAIMCNHHEHYNGTGYPEGIRGENIPIESRILSIADTYEALTADRPYRKAFSLKEVVAVMEYEKGHKLDPGLTDIFLKMVIKDKKKNEQDKR